MICNHHKDAGIVCRCVETFSDIVAGENIPKLASYCALVRAAASRPAMLQGYASDLLVHDRRQLTEYAGEFVWGVRDFGTHLVTPSCARDSGWHANPVVLLDDTFGARARAWFHWDGYALHEVDTKTATRIVDGWMYEEREEAS